VVLHEPAGMVRLCSWALLGSLLCVGCVATRAGARMQTTQRANPIRRVVTMLQMMQKKVEEEGEKEKKMYDEFMCYCKTGGATLSDSIKDAETKIPQLESALEEAGAEKAQVSTDIVQHKKDREAAKAAMDEATAIRKKEAAEFGQESSDANSNIDAMGKAIAALEKGLGGGFLQTPAAETLKEFLPHAELDEADHDAVLAFLAQAQGQGDDQASGEDSPGSNEIVGILKQLKEDTKRNLDEATAQEAKAKADYEGLLAAKTKEVDALQTSIEEKTTRLGEVGVELVEMAEDLDGAKTTLAEDGKFLKDLGKNCKTKKDEWEERSKLRTEEVVAIADTIKILNDDDALDMFKKTLPGAGAAALLQVPVTSKELRREALDALKPGMARAGHRGKRRTGDVRLNLIGLALRGKKVSMEHVTQMIDEMVVLLKKEQDADEKKKAYCKKELDVTEDEMKTLQHDIEVAEKMIAESQASVETLVEEIAALEAGIKALDKQVAEATAQRQEEHEDYVEALAANSAAKKILGIAKDRLSQFYGLQARAASRARRQAPALLQVAAHAHAKARARVHDAPKQPESWGSYEKKGEESAGVLQMLDMLARDLATEIQEMETNEKVSQQDYEEMVADSKEKRAEDSKILGEKEGVKADLQAALQQKGEEKKSKMMEAMATAKYLSNLHGDCDWLLENFDVRTEARTGEIDALEKAKAVLSGADFSLVQTSVTHRRLRLRRARHG